MTVAVAVPDEPPAQSTLEPVTLTEIAPISPTNPLP